MPITEAVTIPPRSRTFTEDEAKTALAALKSGKNIGYGEFDTAAAARSAGTALNRLIQAVEPGSQKWATTVFKQGDKFVGAMLPKPAKVVTAAKKGGSRKK